MPSVPSAAQVVRLRGDDRNTAVAAIREEALSGAILADSIAGEPGRALVVRSGIPAAPDG